jgi:hypothetical protein
MDWNNDDDDEDDDDNGGVQDMDQGGDGEDDGDSVGDVLPPAPAPVRRRQREQDAFEEQEDEVVRRADVRQEHGEDDDDDDGGGGGNDVHQFYVDEEDFLHGYEDEEHDAGMVLPNVELTNSKVYYRELFRVIVDCANANTAFLNKILKEGYQLTSEELHTLRVRIKYWTIYLVENYYHVLGNIVTIPSGPNGEAEMFSGAIGVLPEIWRMKLLVHHAILPDLQSWKLSDSEFLRTWFLETPGVPLDCPPKHPVLAKTKNGEIKPDDQRKYDYECTVYAEKLRDFDATKKITETPVLLMNQKKVMRLVQYMTAKIRITPYHPDLVKLLEMLELKTAMFFCQTMPGELMTEPLFRVDMHTEIERMIAAEKAKAGMITTPQQELEEATGDIAALLKENNTAANSNIKLTMWEEARPKGAEFTGSRDFWFFCTMYFIPLKRSLYWAENFPRLILPRPVDKFIPNGATDRLKDWIAMLAKQQGNKFHDRLEDAAKEGLVHDGDLDWLGYRYPSDGTDPVTVLRKVRGIPEYDDFHEQMQFSWETVLNQVNVNWMSTMYVMHVFDRYMNAYHATQWMDGYVITNANIDEEDIQTKWQHSREPFLVNVCGGFWLMMDGEVVEIYDVYKSICMWLIAVRLSRKHVHLPKDCLADRTNIGDIIDRIIFDKKADFHVVDKVTHKRYSTNMERGIPQTTTRMHI